MNTLTESTTHSLPSSLDDAANAIVKVANKAAKADVYDNLWDDEGLMGTLVDALSFSYGMKLDADFADRQKMLEAAAETALDIAARVLIAQRTT